MTVGSSSSSLLEPDLLWVLKEGDLRELGGAGLGAGDFCLTGA